MHQSYFNTSWIVIKYEQPFFLFVFLKLDAASGISAVFVPAVGQRFKISDFSLSLGPEKVMRDEIRACVFRLSRFVRDFGIDVDSGTGNMSRNKRKKTKNKKPPRQRRKRMEVGQ